MKRLLLAAVAVLTAAAAFASWSAAAPTGTNAVSSGAKASAAKPLPKLPANIKARKRWVVGVKCDAPPFGYIDVKGKNAGFDVEIAQWFARYAFGNKNRVTYECAPTAVREPLLTGDRVDLVISTFTYTTDRDTRIDFSRAYYKATGRLLVKNDSSIRTLADIAGKKISTTSGSVYDRWMRNCFKTTTPDVQSSFSNALLAFQQGRSDAVMFDDTVLAPVAAADRTSKLTDDLFLALPYGIGIKQGNTALKSWVDSRLNLMKNKDTFLQILKNNIAPRFVASYSKNILRPKQTFGYAPAGSPSADTVCP
ncbi:MAG: substrate-binding periplasmic protein [Gaiellaceae bacterium]